MSNFFSANALLIVARLLGLAVAIPFHEVAHAWVSDKLGDPTARSMGRLTLNPIKHIDPLGLLSMLIIGVGWAKPVPVNPAFYKNRKGGMALTAAAGPAANLLLALVSMLLLKVAMYTCLLAEVGGAAAGVLAVLDVVWQLLYYFTIINISLALFNLLPIPPLDGSRILALVLPQKWFYAIAKVERYIMICLLAVIFILPKVFGIDPIGWLLGDAVGAVYNALRWLTGFVDMIFLQLA